MLRVATFNVNGIRAAHRRGFEAWLTGRDCDVVALQEVRAPIAALPERAFGDYYTAYDPGTAAGRNGVAILTRMPPAAIRGWGAPAVVLGPDGAPAAGVGTEPDHPAYPRLARELREFASQGRYLEVDLADAPLTVASLYLPKGGLPAHLQVPGRMREKPDGGARYERKMRFLAGFARQVTAARRAARARGREFLLLGDFNIALARRILHQRHGLADRPAPGDARIGAVGPGGGRGPGAVAGRAAQRSCGGRRRLCDAGCGLTW